MLQKPHALPRRPLTEIEVEGVGTYRLPNQWQEHRIKRMGARDRRTASLAFGLGMSVAQFKKLPEEKRLETWAAYCALMAPNNV